jgi:hypothetical protein
MSNSKLETVITVAVGFIILWLFIDNQNKRVKILELQNEIDDNENLTKEIKARLSDLIHNNNEIDPKIAGELGQILALLDIKQDTTAVLKLAKIIENLLIEFYKGDIAVMELAKMNNRKSPVFADYLQHAMNKRVVSKEDFHLLSIMKIIRNEEAHKLDIKKEKSRIIAAIIAGLGLILTLCNLLKKKSISIG